jgi:large subunit ribosomal protein L4
MAVATYTKTGTKAATAAKLDKAVFGKTPENHTLLQAAYTAYLANGRTNSAVTKKRGEVRGGGRKPWRQKGLGRARFGSTRNPIWRSGGIAFGPTGEENYSKQLNAKAKKEAIRQALSLASADGKIIVIDDIGSKDGKTAELAKLLAKIGASRNILIVVEHKTPELTRATRNLPNVKLVSANYVNVYDSLNADTIVFSSSALKTTTTWLSGKKASTVASSSEEAK